MTEEILGPVLIVNQVADLDDTLRRANAPSYGLAGSIFTRSRQRGLGLAARLRSDGLREFSRPKAVTWQRIKAPIDVMTLTRGSCWASPVHPAAPPVREGRPGRPLRLVCGRA